MKIPKSLKIRWAILGWLLCILSLNFILPLSSGEDSEFQFKNGQTSPISAQTNISQSAASPLPSKGEITGERNIFYWLHITDTQAMWESESQKLWYSQFITDVYDLIQPKMIINTGDLVNSDYHGIFNEHSGQRSWEWETYKSLNDAAGMNNRTLYDVLGNHDVYGDPGNTWFKNYSVQKQLQYDFIVNLSTAQGMKKYHFIGLNTADKDGAKFPFHLFGILTDEELDWYESRLQANQDADMTVVFGHHPAYEILRGGDRFFSLNKKYGVDLYLFGHQHRSHYEMVDKQVVSYETAQLGDPKDSYRIVAIDNDFISTQIFDKGEWPVGIITNPTSSKAVYGDLSAEKISDLNEIRVLAWDPEGISSVQIRIQSNEMDNDNPEWTDWYSASHEEGPLYLISLDLTQRSLLLDGEKHTIQAKLIGETGENIIEIGYLSTRENHWGWYYMRPLVIASSLITLLGLPLLVKGLRKAKKIKPKREDEHVDPTLRKWLIIKFLAFLFVPLTFAPIFPGELVAVFSFFYWRPSGIVWYALNQAMSLIPFLLGMMLISALLSPRWKYVLVFFLLPSLIITSFLLYMFYANFGGIALIAPGYYMYFICDFMLMRRAFQLIFKKFKG